MISFGKIFKAFLFLFAIVVIVSCGRESVSPVFVDAPLKIEMVAWAAPWCSICKKELPQIQKAYDALPKADQDRIEFVMYVPTGVSSSDPPTQAIADKYAASLKVRATVRIDPKWAQFKKYVGGSLSIPQGAIVDSSSALIQSVRASSNFANDLISYATR